MQGLAREIFTDAGKYVIHFGTSPAVAVEEAHRVEHAIAASKNLPPPSALPAVIATSPGNDVIVSSTGNQLVCIIPGQ